jgi:hypothetical protein
MFRTSSRLTRSAGWLGLALALVLVALSGAACSDDEAMAETATVRYDSLEGGVYLLVSDSGARYEPVNLAHTYRYDGTRVRFRAKPATGWASAHMAAPLIEIIEIELIGARGTSH